jgi:hypothetical protein
MNSFTYLINVDPFGRVVKHSGIFIFASPAKVVGGGLEGWRGSFFLSLENRSFLVSFLICGGVNQNFSFWSWIRRQVFNELGVRIRIVSQFLFLK